MSYRPNELFLPKQQREYSMCLWYIVGRKMSDKNLEQRVNFKFCVKIGKSVSEMLALLTLAYGEYTMKKSNVFEWRRLFKQGRDVQDDPRSGQPKKAKERCKCGQSTNLGEFSSKIRCKTNSRRRLWEFYSEENMQIMA
jgi:hypothetical protein